MKEGEREALRSDKFVDVGGVREGEDAFGAEEVGKVGEGGREEFEVVVDCEVFVRSLKKLHST